MTKLKKITPLTQERIDRIIENSSDLVAKIAAISKKVIEENPNYKILIESYNGVADKEVFLKNNQKEIARFLNACQLIGAANEEIDPITGEVRESSGKNYIIGAEGVDLVMAIASTKDWKERPRLHDVKAVKNTQNIHTSSNSYKHTDIMLERDGVNLALQDQLTSDLKSVGTDQFHKTYLIEAFGTTGGNHFVTLTIHKEANETTPLIHLFDPSPSVVRNGVEAAQNSVANGWCSQLMVNATLKSVFSNPDLALNFDSNRYYNNSEPLQQSGYSLCTTFAYEMADIISRMTPEEHIAQLEDKYIYRGPYGGITEMQTMDENGKIYETTPAQISGLRIEDITISHFTDTSLRAREEELKATVRQSKHGEQTLHDRVTDYQSEFGFNDLAEQKILRHRAHLFELLANKAFQKAVLPDQEMEHDLRMGVKGSPFFPRNDVVATPSIINAINGILPRFKVNNFQFDEEGNLTATLYLGSKTASNLENFARENEFSARAEKIDLSRSLSQDVHPDLSSFQKITINISKDKIEQVENKLRETELKRNRSGDVICDDKGEPVKILKNPVYRAQPHPFMPCAVTTPISGIVVKSELVDTIQK